MANDSLRAGPRTMRKRIFGEFRARAKKLDEKEAALHAAMHPDVANALKGTRLLLLGDLLRPVELLVRDLAAGFPTVGEMRATGASPPEGRPAWYTLEDR